MRFTIVTVAALLHAVELTAATSAWRYEIAPLPPPTSVRPPSGAPKVRMLSYSPLIMHMENFVSPDERAYLVALGMPNLKRSMVVDENGASAFYSGRTSSTAFLPRRDVVVTAIAKRAAEFQGYQPRYSVDAQVTHYQQGQHFEPHLDWFSEDKVGRFANHTRRQRLSTFFVVLEAECAKCGTQFTRLKADWSVRDRRWCQLVDCDEELVTTKPIPGSAIFWVNLDENGQGRGDVMHAGLPVMNGTKTGLNIWTTIDTSDEEYDDDDDDDEDEVDGVEKKEVAEEL